MYLTEVQAALLISCLFPKCEMRWQQQFSCSAICYWLSSSAMSCMLSANTTTDHLRLQSVLEKYFQSSVLNRCKLPQVHSSHLWKWGLFFLAHQHLTVTRTQKTKEVWKKWQNISPITKAINFLASTLLWRSSNVLTPQKGRIWIALQQCTCQNIETFWS